MTGLICQIARKDLLLKDKELILKDKEIQLRNLQIVKLERELNMAFVEEVIEEVMSDDAI